MLQYKNLILLSYHVVFLLQTHHNLFYLSLLMIQDIPNVLVLINNAAINIHLRFPVHVCTYISTVTQRSGSAGSCGMHIFLLICLSFSFLFVKAIGVFEIFSHYCHDIVNIFSRAIFCLWTFYIFSFITSGFSFILKKTITLQDYTIFSQLIFIAIFYFCFPHFHL